MATRKETLQKFNLYSTEVLEKLVVIADSIITPMEGQLTSVDYASMVDLVFKNDGLADTYFPAWTDRSDSDFGRLLVELFCLFSDKDFFYINHYFKEAFGLTCEIYSNLVIKAISNGYTPPKNAAASGNFTLVMNASLTDEIVPRGAISIGIPKIPQFNFVNDEFTVSTSTTQATYVVPFRNGEIKTSSGNFNGRSIVITDKLVVDGSIILNIAGNVWTEVASFTLDSTTADKVFMVLYNDKGQAEIRFSKGGYGAFPTTNSIYSVEYLVGGGIAGNILSNTLTDKIADASVCKVASFKQTATSGGSNLQSLEQLRASYLSHQTSLGVIRTKNDAELKARELTFVHNAKGESVSNYLFLYVVPVTGMTFSDSQLQEIEAFLLPLMNMYTGLSLATPIYSAITLKVNLYLLDSISKTGARAVASEVIEDYLSPNIDGDFLKGLNLYDLASLLKTRIFGLQNVDFDEAYKGIGSLNPTTTNITVDNHELINYESSVITINIVGGIEDE